MSAKSARAEQLIWSPAKPGILNAEDNKNFEIELYSSSSGYQAGDFSYALRAFRVTNSESPHSCFAIFI